MPDAKTFWLFREQLYDARVSDGLIEKLRRAVKSQEVIGEGVIGVVDL